MAEVIYRVQAPDGTILKIQGPEGATEADLQGAAESHYASMTAKKPSSSEKFVSELPKELFQRSHPVAQLAIGAAKPVAGLLQYAGVNEPARFLEKMSQRFEEGSGGSAKVFDIAGQVVSPVPTKVAGVLGKGVEMLPGGASALTKAGSMLDKSVLAKSAAQGAGMAALTPTESPESYQDFLAKKAKEVGEGALLGGALGKAGQLVFDPKVTKYMQELKDLGMKYFTPGQLASQIPLVGESIRKMESAATSIPIAGNLIERGAQKVNEQFNKAIGDRVLAPMGEKVPKDIKAGEELIEYVNNRVSDAYNKLTPQLSLTNAVYKNPASTTGFKTTTDALNDKLAEVTKGLPAAQANNLGGMVREEFSRYILDPLNAAGKMTGKEFRDAEKNLGRVAYSYMRNPQYYDVGVALRELQSELRRELAYQNPKVAKELQNIHLAFRRHLPMERAASYVGAEGRVFGPSQFESAVKAETKGKGQFASGQGLLYPESQAAVNVLGKKVPDSGTAQRMMTGTALLTAPLHWKASLLPTLATGSLYNVPAMRGMTALATERPEAMRRLGEPVRGGLSQVGGVMAAQPDRKEE